MADRETLYTGPLIQICADMNFSKWLLTKNKLMAVHEIVKVVTFSYSKLHLYVMGW